MVSKAKNNRKRRDIFSETAKLLKRRKNKDEVIQYDESQRAEFLTGFHKRKLERKKKIVEKIKEKVKEEKREARKVKREKSKDFLDKVLKVDEISSFLKSKANENLTEKVEEHVFKGEQSTSTVLVMEPGKEVFN